MIRQPWQRDRQDQRYEKGMELQREKPGSGTKLCTQLLVKATVSQCLLPQVL